MYSEILNFKNFKRKISNYVHKFIENIADKLKKY